jgi:hypothetical protein
MLLRTLVISWAFVSSQKFIVTGGAEAAERAVGGIRSDGLLLPSSENKHVYANYRPAFTLDFSTAKTAARRYFAPWTFQRDSQAGKDAGRGTEMYTLAA